jgi:hypothetical protein
MLKFKIRWKRVAMETRIMKSQIHAIALISRQTQKQTQNMKPEAIYREQQRQKRNCILASCVSKYQPPVPIRHVPCFVFSAALNRNKKPELEMCKTRPKKSLPLSGKNDSRQYQPVKLQPSRVVSSWDSLSFFVDLTVM